MATVAMAITMRGMRQQELKHKAQSSTMSWLRLVKHENLAIGHHARTSQLTALQYLRVGCSQCARAVGRSGTYHSSAARLQALVRQVLARDAVWAMANRHVEAQAADAVRRKSQSMALGHSANAKGWILRGLLNERQNGNVNKTPL